MQNLIFEQLESDIYVLKINRPHALNALDKETLLELEQFLATYRYEAPFKVLIITGSGNKSFVAGADIKEMQAMQHLDMLQFCTRGQDVFNAFAKAPFVLIAAINGYALGGGLEMAMAADFIYASRTAKLALPEVSLGIIPGFGGTQRLARMIGISRAKELIMSGRLFSAEEGKNMGLINKVCEPEELIPACVHTAKEIRQHSFWAVLQAKRAINVGAAMSLEEALEVERNMCAAIFDTQERVNGMQAFIEKRGKQ